MKSSFFIIADRGNLKAFKAEKPSPERAPRLQLVQEVSFAEAHRKISEINTDLAGRFPVGSANVSGSGPGRHQNAIAEKHYEIENDRRSARQLGGLISDLLRKEHPSCWSLALPSDLKEQVLNEVDKEFHRSLAEYVPRDLVHVAAPDLLSHFSEVKAA